MSKGFEQTFLKRRFIRGQPAHEKMLNIIREQSLGKCKSKSTITYHSIPTKMSRIKIDHNKCRQMWRMWNSHSLLVRLQNGAIILENCLPIAQITRYIFIIQPSRSTPTYISKRSENICLYRNLNVPSSIFHKSHKGEITLMSINR